MFCPDCRSEYRSGFTRCPDCNVDLVVALPDKNSPEAFDVLWRGEEPVLHETLCEELQSAGIEYSDTPLDVYLRRSRDIFNLSLGPRFGFVVSVRAGNLPRARVILERHLDREPVDASVPDTGDRSDQAATINASLLPLHWDPLTATVEIWTGHNADRLQFLSNSLREVGIPLRTLEQEQGNLRLLVRSEDEAIAREVVGQVLEAATPERSVPRPEEDIWHDEPVRSYLFAWLPAAICIGVFILADLFSAPWADNLHWTSAWELPFPLVSFINYIGFLWMVYQAVRYEIWPLRFVLLAFLPFSFIWYYYERYSRRQGRQRLPIVVRERISTRPSA